MQTRSRDAYLAREGNTFRIGTERVEKSVTLSEGGSFTMSSYINKLTGSEYVSGGTRPSDEFAITMDGTQYSGSDGGWELRGVTTAVLSQAELAVVITLENAVLRVERHYVAYPGVGVIQEWTGYQNISGKDARIDRPRIYVQRLMHDGVGDTDFLYMTGGGNFSGSTILKKACMRV